MKVAVITNDVLKGELLHTGPAVDVTIEYCTQPVPVENADCCIDLLFEPVEERVRQLQSLSVSFIIINSVAGTLHNLPSNFVRINGWPTFLKRAIAEVSSSDEKIKKEVEELLSCFGKKTEWVPDIPGFLTARVVSTLINEAYFTLEENVSTKEEIDTAMKLGTNYPYGPFEWARLIGLKKIDGLLSTLAATNPRYSPATLLKQEALLS